MGTRFSRLRLVRQAFLDANIDLNTLPANNKIRNFDTWINNSDNRVLGDGVQPLRGTSDTVSLAPFSFPDGLNNRILVEMSGRILNSQNILTNLDGFNLITNNPEGDAKPSFSPAQAVLAVKNQGAAITTQTSAITGRSYRRTTGTSFTIPFGKGDASDTQFSVMEAIILARGESFVINFNFEHLSR